jgi:hypothetical protein
MATQLRDYRIVSGALDQFVEEWRTRLWPIRLGLGFTLDGAWVDADQGRFLWMISYPGDWEAFASADRAYHDSPERAALDPDPARFIGEQSTLRLTVVEVG